tara:strand:- start:4525 stop:5208 length:684 start_codon:yes stop_codon:yes gene_type:complete
MKHIIKYSIYISLFIQIITTAISLDGLNYSLDEKDRILQDILKLEAFVQFVETGFYIWVIYSIMELKKVTSRRYLDWFITTPTMLISTIIFMEYSKQKEKNKTINFWEFLKDHKNNIYKIILLNYGMLIFGLLGELEYYNKYLMIFIGFIFFYYLFRFIYIEYARYSKISIKLFYFLVIVWGLYGFAAILNIKYKNLSYNFLDIISKNFYGLFIYYKILQAKSITFN